MERYRLPIFAERLENLMSTEPKTTQEVLAQAIGVTRQAISSYKAGRSKPDCEIVARIAKYFNVSADWLLGLDIDPSTEDRTVFERAIERYGKIPQMMVAIEEMSELTKELCKNFRGNDNEKAIAEEIADVEIMLEQLKIIFQCENDVTCWKVLKLSRLKERLN